jgi:hypothetical protein
MPTWHRIRTEQHTTGVAPFNEGGCTMRNAHSVVVRVLHQDDGSIERFWSNVSLDASPAGCWEWRGAVKGSRHLTFFIGSHSVAAARVAWFIATGELPIGGRLLHVCENDYCVRPTHLLWAIGWRTNRTRNALGDGYLTAPVPLAASGDPDAPEARRFEVRSDPSVPPLADPARKRRCA